MLPSWKVTRIHKLISEGRSDRQVADVLAISRASVKDYRNNPDRKGVNKISNTERAELLRGWR